VTSDRIALKNRNIPEELTSPDRMELQKPQTENWLDAFFRNNPAALSLGTAAASAAYLLGVAA